MRSPLMMMHALQHVLQLAHVARPGVTLELRRALRRRWAFPGCCSSRTGARRRSARAEECLRRARAGSARAAARRSGDRTGPRETCLRRRFLQILVSARDHAHVHLHGTFGADLLDLAALQHAQDLRLRGQRQVRDFVEEDRAAMRDFEQSLAWRRRRTGERAALVAEQLALDQTSRESPSS